LLRSRFGSRYAFTAYERVALLISFDSREVTEPSFLPFPCGNELACRIFIYASNLTLSTFLQIPSDSAASNSFPCMSDSTLGNDFLMGPEDD
jgi:hypothetical protein